MFNSHATTRIAGRQAACARKDITPERVSLQRATSPVSPPRSRVSEVGTPKRWAYLLVGTLWLLGAGPSLRAQVAEVHTFTNLNRLIPDNNAAGLSDPRSITSSIVSLSSLRLRLRIAGEFNGDLYSYVRHIQGATTNFCVVLNRVGRSGSNSNGYADAGFDIILDDAALQGDIHVYQAVTNPPSGTSLTGVWAPDGRNVDPDGVLDTMARPSRLSSFTNVNASGEWTLYLADMAAGGTNMLLSWELDFNGIAAPTVTWPAPADIVYGTALGGAQLNAYSPVAGTFNYSPAAGTVLNAGSNQLLSVTFTPTDTTSYVSVTTNVNINVLKTALTITALSTNKAYGAPLPTLGASYSGFVNGDTTNSLSARAVLGTTAVAASPVGSYPITASGAAGSNYTFSYVDGSLTITKASTIGTLISSANPSLPGQAVAFTFTVNAAASGQGTPAGTAQFKIDGTNAGAAVSLSGGTASLTNSTLAHGLHTVAAEYAGDANFTGTTNLLSPNELINTPPVAGAHTIVRDPASGVRVSIATLLSNDTDADADLISFLGVSAASAYGGTLVSNNGWISYTPSPGFTNTDTFTYTISDGLAAPVTGLVTVNVVVDDGPSVNLTITVLSNGLYVIRGDGIPGRAYRMQYADQPQNTNWQTLGTVTADQFGIFEITDAAGTPQRYYRSIYP